MQKSNIKMENDKSKFKKISHGLTRINTDIKKYFIVLNKIKLEWMGGQSVYICSQLIRGGVG
jgi:hypothetical protein